MGTQKVPAPLIFASTTATTGSFQFGDSTGVSRALRRSSRTHPSPSEEQLENPPRHVREGPWCWSVAVFPVDSLARCSAYCQPIGYHWLPYGILQISGDGCHTLGQVVISLLQTLHKFVPMRIGEMSPPALREPLGIVIGILVAQIFGVKVILGSEHLWPMLLGFTILPSFLQKEEDSARKALQRLWGSQDVNQDIQEMKEESMGMSQEKQATIPELLTAPHDSHHAPALSATLRNQCCVLFLNRNLQNAGVEEPISATVGAGVVNTIVTVVFLFLVERAGRRTLHMTGLGGMASCSILTAMSMLSAGEYSWMSFICIGAILVFVAFFEIGPGPGPGCEIRGYTTTVYCGRTLHHGLAGAGCSDWASTFWVGLLFPAAAFCLGPYTFIVFTGFFVIFLVFAFLKVPETHGRTFEESTGAFAGQAHMANRAERGAFEMKSRQPAHAEIRAGVRPATEVHALHWNGTWESSFLGPDALSTEHTGRRFLSSVLRAGHLCVFWSDAFRSTTADGLGVWPLQQGL
ncbi:LOW QUALITY PROTEIN: hypothetical protein QTO34_009738 [Cnephaeus nilssonii]|uniref:Uncharacterized protein n=1 Tax=Cnephaeus nilssonii TaxID=3371016 RepID=A0AA40HIH0_CNENI|nr:LOW QUALITY PROTEIN: hypothetical protein QTO34_009738 [Eptesicus nilssonii]